MVDQLVYAMSALKTMVTMRKFRDDYSGDVSTVVDVVIVDDALYFVAKNGRKYPAARCQLFRG